MWYYLLLTYFLHYFNCHSYVIYTNKTVNKSTSNTIMSIHFNLLILHNSITLKELKYYNSNYYFLIHTISHNVIIELIHEISDYVNVTKLLLLILFIFHIYVY